MSKHIELYTKKSIFLHINVKIYFKLILSKQSGMKNHSLRQSALSKSNMVPKENVLIGTQGAKSLEGDMYIDMLGSHHWGDSTDHHQPLRKPSEIRSQEAEMET